MRGTPYFYYGEEIGMTNIKFSNISEYKDINTLNRYETLRQNGGDLEAFLLNEKTTSRDNARTPMQWDLSKNSGFTKVEPWLKVNKNHTEGINVSSQEADKNSVLNYFRAMVRIRKNHQAFIYGSYELLLETNEKVYAYTRALNNDSYLVLLSFSVEQERVTIDKIDFKKAELLISNDDTAAINTSSTFELKPYQASIYRLF
jgi:oligo-1,6-glucosidase